MDLDHSKLNCEFGYNWNQLWGVILVIPVILGFIFWKEGELNFALMVFMIIVFIFMTLKQLLTLMRVHVTFELYPKPAETNEQKAEEISK